MKTWFWPVAIAFGLAGVITMLGSAKSDRGSPPAVINDGPYLQKATSSVSSASALVGNFPLPKDRAEYASGLERINHLHENIHDFTIYQVIATGRDVLDEADARAQERADRLADSKVDDAQSAADDARDKAYLKNHGVELAANAKREQDENRASAERSANETYLIRGKPDCLVLDTRSLTTESGEYVAYVKGIVKNTCTRSFDYVQVEMNFYKSGNLIKSGLANINNLASGESWSWKEVSDVAGGTWRVTKITGF